MSAPVVLVAGGGPEGARSETPESSEVSGGSSPSESSAGRPRRRRAKRAPVARKKQEPRGHPSGPLADVLAGGGGLYRVRLAAFSGVPGPLAQSLARILAAGPGGPDEWPAGPPAAGSDPAAGPGPPGGAPDLLIAAAASGATANPAFLDILDGGDFEPAPCLCCYVATSAKSARKAATALRLFQRYYDVGSYLGSRAYPRMVQTLGRDLAPEELAAIKGHLSWLEGTTDLIRAINAHPAICVAAPPCRPETVWVYSTPASRKMLRHLGRRARAGLSLSVGVASSDPALHPRWRYRMYSAALHHTGPEPGEKRAARATRDSARELLGAMRDWVLGALRSRSPGGPSRR